MAPHLPTSSQELAFNMLKNKKVITYKGEIQPNLKASYIWNEQRGAPEIIEGLMERIKGDYQRAAVSFVNEHRGLFYPEKLTIKDLPADAYEAIDHRPGLRDTIHVRLRQTVKGVPVWGSMWKVHMDVDGTILGMSGAPHPIRSADLPKGPFILPREAIQVAKEHHRPAELTEIEKPQQFILIQEGKPHYVYVFDAVGMGIDRGGVERTTTWLFFVDAVTKAVIRQDIMAPGTSPICVPFLKSSDVQGPVIRSGDGTNRVGSGFGHYCPSANFPTKEMTSSSDPNVKGKYIMVDDTAPTGVEVHASTTSPKKAELSIDDDNKWCNEDQEIDVDAYVNTIYVRDYFANRFDRKIFFQSKGREGHPMIIHALRKEGAAYWDPKGWIVNVAMEKPDHPWWGPHCSLDVIAHEWAHAFFKDEDVLPYTNYWSETSSLSEGLADAFAQFITNDPEWIRGRSNWKLTCIAKGCRNMGNPTNGGIYDPLNPFDSYLPNASQPDHMDDYVDPENCTAKNTCPYHANQKPSKNKCTLEKSPCMPSHLNQGIINKVTYLMAQGGVHRDIDVGPGMGTEILEHLYYHCIVDKMPHHDHFVFRRFKQYLLSTLNQLYGESAQEKIKKRYKDNKSDKEKLNEELRLARDYYDFWAQTIKNAFASVGVEKNDNATIPPKPTGIVNWP